MKIILLIMFIVLFTAASVFCGEGENTAAETPRKYTMPVDYEPEFEDEDVDPANDSENEYDAPDKGAGPVAALRKEAEQGNVEAQYVLGSTFFYFGTTEQIFKESAYWLEKASEQGHAEAQYLFGGMYSVGRIVPQDYKQAARWWIKSSEQEHPGAQYFLGLLYSDGQGVPQNDRQAAYWYKKAAEQGHANAQYNLGLLYATGRGVPQNFKLAYVWESLAAAQGDQDATHNRDIAVKKLTSQQLSEAQDLAAKIQYQTDNAAESSISPPGKPGTGEIIGTGTGFLITRDGHILTCLHVVQDAARIEIYVGDKTYPASLVREDLNNDLAILKINGSFQALAFSPHRSAKMGQDVFTVGYPNPDLQGLSPKYTEGTVSNLTGLQDDLRLYQISAPIQPGNSGGALLDEYGNILGVVIAMLNAKTTFQISGSLPQNVNYAVKSLYEQAMIDTLPDVAGNLVLLIDEIEYPQGAADHLMSALESEGLLPPWLTYREPKTAALDLLDPEINTRINDLLGAWLLTDNLPNKPVLVNNKEAERIIKG